MQVTIEQAMSEARRQQQAGQFAQAEAIYRHIREADPGNAEALHMLGVLWFQSGRHEGALQLIQQAIAIHPAPEYFGNLGIVASAMGRLQEGINAYRKALSIKPDYPEALCNLGNALVMAGNSREAVDLCRRAVALRPTFAEAFNNLSNALNDQERSAEGLAAAQEALRLRSAFPEAHNNAGNALLDLNRIDEAIEQYRLAIVQFKDYLHAHFNLAGALRRAGKLDEAAEACRAAIAIQNDFPQAHVMLSEILLASGNWRAGWEEYEWRRKVPDFKQPPILFLGRKPWTGQDLRGKRLLVYTEENIGAAIQFVRLMRLLEERGAKTILLCQPELKRLFSRTLGVSEIHAMDTREDPPYDFYIGLPSVAGVLQIDDGTIPKDVPYIFAEGEEARGPEDKRLKVGIAESGDGDTFGPLAEIDGVSFTKLGHGTDLAETAAVIGNLDLVIAADNEIAHLAGAMGKRTWLVLPDDSDWRWMRDRTDSPWYPTVRIFRATPVGEIVKELRA